jgi:hypothetical protein
MACNNSNNSNNGFDGNRFVRRLQQTTEKPKRLLSRLPLPWLCRIVGRNQHSFGVHTRHTRCNGTLTDIHHQPHHLTTTMPTNQLSDTATTTYVTVITCYHHHWPTIQQPTYANYWRVTGGRPWRDASTQTSTTIDTHTANHNHTTLAARPTDW